MNTLTLSADVELQAAAKTKSPRLRILAYTGGWLENVSGYGRALLDLKGLELAEVPLLTDHQNSLDAILGWGHPEVRDGQLVVTGSLAATGAAGRVEELLRSGVKLQASIGMKPTALKYVREKERVVANGRTLDVPGGGATVVVSGKLKEVSIVAIGADDATAVTLAAKKENTMPQGTTTTTTTPDPDPNSPEQIRAAERERLQAIDTACSGFAAGDRRVADLRAQAISGELELPALNAALLDHLRNSRATTPRPSVGQVRPEVTRDILAAAALLATGMDATAEKQFGADVCQRAADLRCRNTVDFARECLRFARVDEPAGVNELLQAAFSTTSMPAALGLAGEKILAEVFQDTPRTWESWCAKKTVKTFREHTSIRPYLGQAGYDQVAQNGELKHATLNEETYTYQAETFGKLFTVTRKTMINDDLGAVWELVREIGRQGVLKISDRVYTLLQSAAAEQFFTEALGSLMTGLTSELCATALAKAIEMLRSRVDASNRHIDIQPHVIVVPPALEMRGKSLLNSINLERSQAASDQEPTANPLYKAAGLEVEPRLTSTVKWYLFSHPRNVPAVNLAFLNGIDRPNVAPVETPADILGQTYRAYIDFDASFADPRAAIRANGQ